MRQRLIPAAGRPWSIRIKVGTSWDPDFSAFNAIVGITDPSITIPVNEFYQGAKADGVYVNFHDFLPIVGATAVKHAIWGKNPNRAQVSWVGSPTHNASGVKGNGTSQHGDLNWNPVAEGCNPNNFGIIGFRKGSDTGTAGRVIVGMQSASGHCTALETTQTTLRDAGYIGQQGDSEPTPSGNPSPLLEDGVHIITSIGTTVTYYRNKANLGTRTRSSGFLNANMYAFARNQNGSVARRSARTLSFIGFTTGLTETQAALLSDRITSLQLALGRG